MKINPYIFRGYDLRGIVGQDLTPEIVEVIGRCYGTYLKRRGINEALVGRDSRQTSPAYSQALIAGFNFAGVDTIDIGLNLVGTFYWAQYFLNRKGGGYISASHNPVQYNGFKLAIDFSETLISEGIQELRQMVENDDFVKADNLGKNEEREIREAYFEDILKRLSINKKFKVVVDSRHSTAGVIAPELFRRTGCEVIENNCELDSTFPLGTPDPIDGEWLSNLSKKVLMEKADIGFAYDADGDRIGIVDEKGGIIWNDILTAIFAMDVLDMHPGAKIMYNILCSKAVKETILAHGGIPFMWRVGHSLLKKKNQEVGAAFIGELSGHFFFSADFYNHDDGLYAALRLLGYMARSGRFLSQIVESLPKYISSPEIKLFCADERKVELIEKISVRLRNDFPDAQDVIDDERAGDGVRLDLTNATLVIRYSQNGPYITIKFEAKDQKQYEQLQVYIKILLRQYEEINWQSDININMEAL